jgi:3-oxoadipate enol-lactonase / 4-carboxymuconolactone decarboxylase
MTEPGARRDGVGASEGVMYDLQGPSNAPVVVLLGSLGTTASVWDSQMAVLRPWARVLRVEHPGHGGSDVPSGEGSLGALGERLFGLLDRLGIERASFAGLSLGGLICMWAALERPQRVERLVVACSAARFNSSETYRERAALVRERGMQTVVEGVIPRWFTKQFRRDRPDVVASYSATLADVDRDGYSYCCEAVASADLSAELSSVVAPTLVVGGALDPVVTPDMAAGLSSLLNGAMLCVLPGAAHLANVAQPAAFNEILVSHLVGSPTERGLEVRKAVLGADHVERALSNASEMSTDFQDLLTRWPWGDIWARPGLDRRTRRLLTVALLAALNRPEELEMHLRRALADGISQAEVKEVLLHCAVYTGVPAANAAFTIAERVVREQAGSAL